MSEWLDLMLEEIERKKRESEADLAEAARRRQPGEDPETAEGPELREETTKSPETPEPPRSRDDACDA